MAVAAKTKTLLHGLVPPLAMRAYRALVPPTPPPFSMKIDGNYGTWQAAAAVCGDGYQADEPVQREARITRSLLSSGSSAPLNGKEIRALAGILSCGTPTTVLDFGGGVGQHFFRLGPHLAVRRWVVCETEAMVTQGRASFARPGLEFISSLDEVASSRFDVAFTAGALQAVPDPGAVLTKLSELAERIVVNRLSLTPWSENRLKAFRVHEAGRTEWGYPMWFLSETWWDKQLENLGLEVTLRWAAPDDVLVVDRETIEFQGMVLSKKHRVSKAGAQAPS